MLRDLDLVWNYLLSRHLKI